MAKRDQVAGFFGALDAGNAGNAQHIAFFGIARLNDGQRRGQHVDAPASHCNPVGAGFAGNVHHVSLALGVKMGKGIHGIYKALTGFAHHTGMLLYATKVPRRRWLIAVLWAAMAALPGAHPLAQTAASVPTSAASLLPALGDGSDMAIGTERRMGDRIAREIYRDPDYIDDPILLEYVDGIWQPLLAAARARGDISSELDERFAWVIMLGRDRTVNAFTLPGGYFGMHLGLLGIVASRDELASVMAHELSHATQRHIPRLMSKQSAQAPWLIGAMILGVLAASKSADAGSALITGGQAVAAQNQLNFSRDMEREADRIGFGVMTQAGFEPQGFASMFDKLQQSSRHNDNGAFPYLRSHPLTTERMADMQARQPLSLASAPPLTMEHAMMAARARALSNPGVDLLRAMVSEGSGDNAANQPPAKRAAVLYAATLAAMQLRDISGAARYLTRLADLTASDVRAQRLVRLADADLALVNNDPARALRQLADVAAGPASRAESLLVARAQLALGQAMAAAQALQLRVASHPRDAMAWQLLSSAYAAQGQPLRSIRAEAEAQVAQLDYPAAMDRFKAAQAWVQHQPSVTSADHIEASIIDTRARQVQSLLAEQAAER